MVPHPFAYDSPGPSQFGVFFRHVADFSFFLVFIKKWGLTSLLLANFSVRPDLVSPHLMWQASHFSLKLFATFLSLGP